MLLLDIFACPIWITTLTEAFQECHIYRFSLFHLKNRLIFVQVMKVFVADKSKLDLLLLIV